MESAERRAVADRDNSCPFQPLVQEAVERRFGRLIATLTNPWLVIPMWVAATWIWAVPAIFDYTAQHLIKPYVLGWEPSPLDSYRVQDLSVAPH